MTADRTLAGRPGSIFVTYGAEWCALKGPAHVYASPRQRHFVAQGVAVLACDLKWWLFHHRKVGCLVSAVNDADQSLCLTREDYPRLERPRARGRHYTMLVS